MKNSSLKLLSILGLTAFLGLSAASYAGDPPELIDQTTQFTEVYEGGRGLITAQGPTGMFLNPTSGTMPKGSFTAQYCFFSPELNGIVGHNWLAAYALTDWLEVAGLAAYNDNSGNFSAGPQARARLMKNDGIIPQISVGYYGLYGNGDKSTAYAAAYNRISIQEDGLVKSLGIHYGIRNSWIEDKVDELRGYLGAELQLPLRVYIIGEVATEDSDIEGDTMPFTYGLQWRSGGINISAAMIQNGALDGGPGFFFGIGSQLTF